MRRFFGATIGTLALLVLASAARRSWSMVANRSDDPHRPRRAAGRQHRLPGPPPGRPDFQRRRPDHDRREQAGRRRHHRRRSGGARGARRQHLADQQQRHADQRHPAQGELRSDRKFRADLLSGHDAANHRRQQRLALSHAGRAAGRGAPEARRAVDRQRRAQHHATHRHRAAQAAWPAPI